MVVLKLRAEWKLSTLLDLLNVLLLRLLKQADMVILRKSSGFLTIFLLFLLPVRCTLFTFHEKMFTINLVPVF